MRSGLLFVAGAALALGPVGTAFAQGGGLCQLVNGAAVVKSGTIDDDTTLESGKFGFTGDLAGPGGFCEGLQVCATGMLRDASCIGSSHVGSARICASCSLSCGGGPCDSTNIDTVTIVCNGRQSSGEFQGVCVGASCSGGSVGPDDKGFFYSLFFDAGTVENALDVCNPTADPTDSIEAAGFGGGLGWVKDL